MKTALMLIDIQNDYFPRGTMELEGCLEASRLAGNILNHFREKGSQRKTGTKFYKCLDGTFF